MSAAQQKQVDTVDPRGYTLGGMNGVASVQCAAGTGMQGAPVLFFA